jgi:hypothetical protein
MFYVPFNLISYSAFSFLALARMQIKLVIAIHCEYLLLQQCVRICFAMHM